MKPINQCDGCRAGIPIIDGLHDIPGYGLICCTKHLYNLEEEQMKMKPISKKIGTVPLESINAIKAHNRHVEQRKKKGHTSSNNVTGNGCKGKIKPLHRKRVIKPLMQTPFANLNKLVTL